MQNYIKKAYEYFKELLGDTKIQSDEARLAELNEVVAEDIITPIGAHNYTYEPTDVI